jgi:hypothetical protein
VAGVMIGPAFVRRLYAQGALPRAGSGCRRAAEAVLIPLRLTSAQARRLMPIESVSPSPSSCDRSGSRINAGLTGIGVGRVSGYQFIGLSRTIQYTYSSIEISPALGRERDNGAELRQTQMPTVRSGKFRTYADAKNSK